MPTKNPRIHIVLEKPLFEWLKNLSARDGLSMSQKARKIISEALSPSEERPMRIYTGRHIKKLIGKFKMEDTNS